MTACAPATKCLFRYLFPYFARSRTHTYYADQSKMQQSSRGSKFGSRKAFGSFQFRRSNSIKANDTAVEEIGMAGPSTTHSNQKGDGVYGMKRLSTVDSRDTIREMQEDKSSMREAEPKHCLGEAK
jgi:hypothetical protein